MSDDDIDLTVQPPDPLINKSVAALIRSGLQFLSGAGFIAGTQVSDEQLLTLASAIVFIATYAWSYREKRHARQLREQAALASAMASAKATAAAGQPVAVAINNPAPGDQSR